MRYLILFTFLCTYTLLLHAQENQVHIRAIAPSKPGFVIEGYIAGLGNKKVYLGNKPEGYGGGFKQIYYDSTYARDGHFIFRGTVGEARYHSVEIAGKRGWVTMLMGNEQVKVTGDTSAIWEATVTGSVEDSLRRDLRIKARPLWNGSSDNGDSARAALQRGDSTAYLRFKKAGDDSYKKVMQLFYDFAVSHPDMYHSLEQMEMISDVFGKDTARSVYNRFSEKVKNHSGAKSVYYDLFRFDSTVALRKAAPVFRQQDSLRNWVSLSSYKGKYVLLDFWASWCGPCRAENPNLLSAYKKYSSRQFEILGIALDSDRKKWLNAVKEDNLPWRHVSDLKGGRNDVAVLFGIKAIPSNFLINPNGIIIAKDLRGEALHQFLEEHLPH